MKKTITIFLILALNIADFHIFAAEQNWIQLKKFIVTAYYSPLPNQSIYLKGNYEDEKRLNWEWLRWASWKNVYAWMLAAPKSYSFWTKIYLKWIWIWTVDDRWWAIVWSWSRGYDWDRIDIWMWHWEEWLKRALTWWKREAYWKVLTQEETLTYPKISLENFEIWKINLNAIKSSVSAWKKYILSSSSNEIYVPEKITANSPESDIKKVQEILKNIWYLKWNIDGKYSKILLDAIADFQIDNKLVNSSFDVDAGYYWIKTRNLLRIKYTDFLAKEQLIRKEELFKNKENINLNRQVDDIVTSIWIPKINEVWSNVRKLQKALKVLWYFESKDTAIYWIQTKESIIKYQIAKWLIRTRDDDWAWKIWSITLKVLKEDLLKIAQIDKEKIEIIAG
ncbi:MAG: hypothetical protein ACD_4C00091G0005 [uncultured bacterium (gcode 4)]|uniref:Peptidoglycan binding-like domain-containing protein n=1 Tax=uncultured bacterium (gcode 4) TaxID=1234023 RepID=K2F762_9BACT|nr:MAG: hypothetical protein ACD_4C00091G0005 [uncultured bacterium (gcode 4)]